MFSVDELLKVADRYRQQSMSLEDFEKWFEDNSAMEFSDSKLNSLRAAVDALLGEYHFDHIGERALRKGLVNAIRPFAESRWKAEVVSPGVFQLKELYPERHIATSAIVQQIRKPPTREIALTVSARRSDLEVVLA